MHAAPFKSDASLWPTTRRCRRDTLPETVFIEDALNTRLRASSLSACYCTHRRRQKVVGHGVPDGGCHMPDARVTRRVRREEQSTSSRGASGPLDCTTYCTAPRGGLGWPMMIHLPREEKSFCGPTKSPQRCGGVCGTPTTPTQLAHANRQRTDSCSVCTSPQPCKQGLCPPPPPPRARRSKKRANSPAVTFSRPTENRPNLLYCGIKLTTVCQTRR